MDYTKDNNAETEKGRKRIQMRNAGIIITLVGVALILISLLFAEGYDPKRSFFESLPAMKCVILKGEETYRYHSSESVLNGIMARRAVYYTIPLKYALAIDVLVILSGVGLILVGGSASRTFDST